MVERVRCGRPASSGSLSSASTCSSRTPTCRWSRRSTTPRSITAPSSRSIWVDAETLSWDEAERRAVAGRRHPDSRAASAFAASRARSPPCGSPARIGCRSSVSAWGCRWRWSSSPATWSAWRAPTRASSTPRRRIRSSTCCPSRRRSRTWAAPCAWAPTRSSWSPGTRAYAAYGEPVVYERHRHRYEVNNTLRPQLVSKGLIIAGTSPDERLVEIIELPEPSLVLRQPVSPRVQVAAQPAAAAVPRLRGGGGRSSRRRGRNG